MKKYLVYGLFVVILLFYLFYIIGTTKITVVFEELEPFKHHLPVYFNGFKLGHTTKVYPSEDYKSTLVDLRIVLKNIKLPANTTAILRRKDKKDYIELDYPSAPYLQTLRHKDKITGHLGVNLEQYLQGQAENGGLDEIKNNVNKTIISAGETFDALTGMIQVVTEILEDARPVIKDSVDNINVASKELANSSTSIRKTLDKGYLDNSLLNIQKTSQNLVYSTNNVNNFTNNANTQTLKLLNCVISNLNIVINNVNEIIIGVGATLKKRFSGLRLLFGKTIT